MNQRAHELLEYLDRLTKLNAGSYNCHKEIAECVLRVRNELNIIKKNDKLLVITLDDENSVPKVIYNGEEIKKKTRVQFVWETKAGRKPGELSFDINYAELDNVGFPTMKGVGIRKQQ